MLYLREINIAEITINVKKEEDSFDAFKLKKRRVDFDYANDTMWSIAWGEGNRVMFYFEGLHLLTQGRYVTFVINSNDGTPKVYYDNEYNLTDKRAEILSEEFIDELDEHIRDSKITKKEVEEFSYDLFLLFEYARYNMSSNAFDEVVEFKELVDRRAKEKYDILLEEIPDFIHAYPFKGIHEVSRIRDEDRIDTDRVIENYITPREKENK